MAMSRESENEIKKFICKKCGFKVNYQYFGKKPPFAKSIILMEDAYVMKDPFSSDGGMITLGSHCSLCQLSVCVAPACSVFYTKRFCLPCIESHIDDFPVEIQQSYSPLSASFENFTPKMADEGN